MHRESWTSQGVRVSFSKEKDAGKQLVQRKLLELFGLSNFENFLDSFGEAATAIWCRKAKPSNEIKERRQRRLSKFLVAEVDRTASIPYLDLMTEE